MRLSWLVGILALFGFTVVYDQAQTVSRIANPDGGGVILGPSEWPLWADPAIRDPGLLNDLLRPASDDLLTLSAVSPLVNNANNEGPALLEPPMSRPADSPLTLFG